LDVFPILQCSTTPTLQRRPVGRTVVTRRRSCLAENRDGEGESMADFEPKILAFLCNWCAYAGADMAGVSRLQYPPNVRSIRVMCSSSVSFENMLKGFQMGTDGILVGG